LRALGASIVLAALVAGTVLAQDPGTPNRDALLVELGRGRVALNDESGTLRFAAGSAARPAASRARLGPRANPRATARAFMSRYSSLFGIRDAARDLRITRESRAAGGSTFVRFEQQHAGVPVIAGELTVQVDAAGNVISAIGEASPELALSTDPTISAANAALSARAFFARSQGNGDEALATTEPRLTIFDPLLVGAPDVRGARLVWQTEVSRAKPALREYLLIDARSGAIALHFNMLAGAKNRTVCDADGDDALVDYPCDDPARVEDDPAAPGTYHEDVDFAYDFSGDWWDFFNNRFGRDSLDAAGMGLISTVNFCDRGNCNAVNAFWDGAQSVYYPGMASDDVVAHEFSHGFTEFTSGLVYIFQSGAINEALSDIFGELVDLANDGATPDPAGDRWLMGEDTALGALRDMQDPPAFGDPDRMGSPNYATDANLLDNGGVHTNSGVANKAAFLMVDGQTFNGYEVTGIGIDKAAAVWYRAATEYLASGSDYADLGRALNQSCTDLDDLDTPILDGTGANTNDDIDAADCTEVAEAVLATEMALQPIDPDAAAPEAPLCTSGTFGTVLFEDDVEDALLAPDWTATGAAGIWSADDFYATSKPYHLWAATPVTAKDSQLMLTTVIANVPASAFLHFRHSYIFDSVGSSFYDGGIVEYQLNGGAWLDAKPLFTHNGYDGTLTSYQGGGNVLANREAFVGFSWGYVSSRISLTTLAGSSQNLRFRFRVATDKTIAYDGWFIDDVRLFTCDGAIDSIPPTVGEPNANLRSGVTVGGTKPIKLNVAFAAADESGLSATEMQRRTGTGTWNPVGLGSPTGTSANLNYKAKTNAKRQFRARATDASGAANQSAWMVADPFRVLAYQNGSAAVVKAGTWKNRSSSSHYGGSAQSSSTLNAKQKLTLNASDFAIVSTTGPNRGKFDVWIDGLNVAVIDLYSPTTRYKQAVYAVDFGVAGSHSIELRVLHTKNAASSAYRVDFDAFLALAP
jgi:Zn-dependent metalloprotease